MKMMDHLPEIGAWGKIIHDTRFETQKHTLLKTQTYQKKNHHQISSIACSPTLIFGFAFAHCVLFRQSMSACTV